MASKVRITVAKKFDWVWAGMIAFSLFLLLLLFFFAYPIGWRFLEWLNR